MCGIAGIFDPQGGHVTREAVEAMAVTLTHRGPDDGDVFVSGPVGLGHRRLSIIDVASGRQPMVSDDGRLALVFNGEIYNYRGLRDVLVDKGHRFKTSSDTEVILNAYREYGETCVQHLRGMFAFALWDGDKRKLVLARDRLGIKPLYYAWDGGRLRFGSEIKAIIQDPGISRDIDPLALDEYLSYLYVPGPRSIFKSVRKLRPGHLLRVSSRGIEEKQYWDLLFHPVDGRSEEACAEGLREKLRESVGLHLMSEVPLGAFLSGGVDSTAVVGTMAELMDRPVVTASIGFSDARFDESAYARLAAAHFRTEAFERTIEAHAAELIDRLVWFYDEPFADSSMVPTYQVSEVARQRVTVALSGDGGDENFAGYRRYRFDVLENRLRAWIPAGIRRSVVGPLARVYPNPEWLPQPLRGKTLLTNLSRSAERGYFNTMTWCSAETKTHLYRPAFKRDVGGYDAFTVMEEHFARTRGWDPLSRIQYVDFKTYLVDDILTKVDRASMAHGLEVRVPLLDHEFVEYAAAIPPRFHLQGGQGKALFKRALRDLVPRPILDRHKMGFGVPLAAWFRGELKGLFEERVLARSSFVSEWLDTDTIRGWWGQHQRGTRDYAFSLWSILILESWARKFLGARP